MKTVDIDTNEIPVDIKFECHTNVDEEELYLTAKIFGHDIWRVFRDEKKNIIKIILKKGNEFVEFNRKGFKD